METGANSKFDEIAARMVALICLLCVVAGISMIVGAFIYLIYSIIFWLKYGMWPPFTVVDVWMSSGLPMPQTSWLGVDRLIIGFLNLGVGLGLVVSGIGLIVSAFLFRLLLPEPDWTAPPSGRTESDAD